MTGAEGCLGPGPCGPGGGGIGALVRVAGELTP